VLRENAITQLMDLSTFPVLEELELYGNQITSVEGLGTSLSLRKLDLSFNSIREISTLSCPNLKELFFVRNKIKRIKGLDSLTGNFVFSCCFVF
jgi:Leucine-rich repeat (LRR) protein